METDTEPVAEVENSLVTYPFSLGEYLEDDVTFKGINNGEMTRVLYKFENIEEKKVEKSVELIPLSNECSMSKALVPVIPELKVENTNFPDTITFPKIKLNFPATSKFKNDFALQHYQAPGRIDFEFTPFKSRDRRLTGRQVSKHFRSRELGMCAIWGKCKIRVQEHRMRLAASTNNVETVEHLLNAGISPNNQDFRGRSPLHLSACRGYTEIVRILLQHNADPNRKDCIGNTPLHLATLTNKAPVVTLLLEAGAKVNTLDSRGFSPLTLAQTRLRLVKLCDYSDSSEVEKQMFEIVNMLRVYLTNVSQDSKTNEWNVNMEKISEICSKLSLGKTNRNVDEVQDEVRELLSNIETLNLS